jgi:predicted acetyltransferase
LPARFSDPARLDPPCENSGFLSRAVRGPRWFRDLSWWHPTKFLSFRIGILDSVTLLVLPDAQFRSSVLAAATEFDGAWMDGAGFVNGVDLSELADAGAFDELVARLIHNREADAVRPDGQVPATSLWMVQDDEVVGFLQIRHRLNDFLLEQGGHIGYSVRPSARRRGLASAALGEALGIAHELGVDPVLVCCDETNVGSRAVIEAAGGMYEDSRVGHRRYWIRTARDS